MRNWTIAFGLGALLPLLAAGAATAAATPATPAAPGVAPAPPRAEGDGPYSQLILRNVVVIRGSGAPAFGPADVVIEGNRIADVFSVGAPGGGKADPDRPVLAAGGREIDLAGHYVMPG